MAAELAKQQFDQKFNALVREFSMNQDWEKFAITMLLGPLNESFGPNVAIGQNPTYDRIVKALTGEQPFNPEEVKIVMDALGPYTKKE